MYIEYTYFTFVSMHLRDKKCFKENTGKTAACIFYLRQKETDALIDHHFVFNFHVALCKAWS